MEMFRRATGSRFWANMSCDWAGHGQSLVLLPVNDVSNDNTP